VPLGPDIPVPDPPKEIDTLEAESGSTPKESEEHSEFGTDTHGTPEPFTQTELNDLLRDLNVPKDAVVLQGHILKENNPLTPGRHVIFYRIREKDLLQYFTQEESLVHRSDIPNPIIRSGLEYETDEWSL
jgi:hypothetical protein